MRRTTTAVGLAALLAIAGCSGSDPDEAPLEFADNEIFNDHIADKYEGRAELNGGSDLMVGVESKNSELQDQDRTVKVLEDVGEGVTFDDKTVSISSKPDKGEWGDQYTRDVAEKVAGAKAGDGSVIVAKIWDHTERGYNTAY
ncbi:hypothetical protein GCM10009689_14780 [Brevibacterium antiquum]|uniref:hypothetical protein n=1 Tax=Brevibacterium antiquum TaxID=234835 RepID=UPI0018DFB6AB|nr:hypothetical protein [Brevibacterium antiquum]